MVTTQSQRRIRPPAVAGSFYPRDPELLRTEVRSNLREADSIGPVPKALIVPHAGYQFSGPVAASGYRLLQPVRDLIKRVVLVGPSHHVPFRGIATCSVDEFATPLGTIPLDHAAVGMALKLPQVRVFDEAHRYEHSLEVHLPFLQLTLPRFLLVPFAVGLANATEVAELLDVLWTDGETLLVISSDLSHYHDYSTARRLDEATSSMIERCQWQQLTGNRACGYGGVRGLLKVAHQRGLRVKTVDLRNSGDTSGIKDEVVGYGCYVVY